ncbi:MAG: hypothetical protein ABIG10_02765 [bacterium]
MNILSLAYWFNTRPEPFTSWTQLVLIILTALLIAAAVWTRIKANKKQAVYKKLWEKSFNFFLTHAIIGILLAFFNFQAVPILMAKFWYALWLIFAIIWIVFFILFITKRIARKAELKKQKEFEKYIP